MSIIHNVMTLSEGWRSMWKRLLRIYWFRIQQNYSDTTKYIFFNHIFWDWKLKSYFIFRISWVKFLIKFSRFSSDPPGEYCISIFWKAMTISLPVHILPHSPQHLAIYNQWRWKGFVQANQASISYISEGLNQWYSYGLMQIRLETRSFIVT